MVGICSATKCLTYRILLPTAYIGETVTAMDAAKYFLEWEGVEGQGF